MNRLFLLPDVQLDSRINAFYRNSGLDNLRTCLDKRHYLAFPWPVHYSYNERGFRGNPWPQDSVELQRHIWCMGDSFTVGIGSPYEHTWPVVLNQKSGLPTINVSMDGASNDWIARKSVRVLNEIQPRVMIIMWSYLARRESPDATLSDEDRRLWHDLSGSQQDIANFQACVQSLIEHQRHTSVMMFAIPKFARFDGEASWSEIKGPDWPQNIPCSMEDVQSLPHNIKKELMQDFDCWDELLEYIELKSIINAHNIQVVPQLDRARDGHHFDIMTSHWVVDNIITHLLTDQ